MKVDSRYTTRAGRQFIDLFIDLFKSVQTVYNDKHKSTSAAFFEEHTLLHHMFLQQSSILAPLCSLIAGVRINSDLHTDLQQ